MINSYSPEATRDDYFRQYVQSRYNKTLQRIANWIKVLMVKRLNRDDFTVEVRLEIVFKKDVH